MHKLWKSLWVSVNHYNEAYKKFNMLEKDVVKITGNSDDEEIKTLQIDKPEEL